MCPTFLGSVRLPFETIEYRLSVYGVRKLYTNIRVAFPDFHPEMRSPQH